jgi:hypothetical protein
MTNEEKKVEKKEVTQVEFDKRVDIEFAYLTYMDRLNPIEAREKAVNTVAQEYKVKK